jgi:hypothetical protein
MSSWPARNQLNFNVSQLLTLGHMLSIKQNFLLPLGHKFE